MFAIFKVRASNSVFNITKTGGYEMSILLGNRINRRNLITGATAGLVVLASNGARAASPAGAVTTVTGEAFATRSKNKLPLQSGASVFVNDTVETMQDGRLVVELEKATVLKLGAQTKLRIDRFLAKKGGVIVIESGAFLFDRPEDAPKTNIEIQSAFAVVAVRGTKFFAGPSKGVYGVFVERGRVRVTAAGKTVRLRAGEGTNIKTPGDPPSDPAVWKKPRIVEAYASVE
jgi:ferric-dicitrate binding protein FerR (iron transport regulator)